MEEITAIAVMMIMSIIYFVPTIVAVSNKSKFTAIVILLNIFTGWTVIGWLVALILGAIGAKKCQ